MKLPLSRDGRQSTFMRKSAPGGGGGRTNMVAKSTRTASPRTVAVSGDSVPTVLYLRLFAASSPSPIMEQQAVIADYSGLYGFAALALGPTLPLVNKIVRLAVQGDAHGVNVDYIELFICNATVTNWMSVYTDPFVVDAGAFFAIGDSGEAQWILNDSAGGVLSIGTFDGDQTLESTSGEAYWVTANCGISA